jgi:hypothetical protein
MVYYTFFRQIQKELVHLMIDVLNQYQVFLINSKVEEKQIYIYIYIDRGIRKYKNYFIWPILIFYCIYLLM